MHEFKVDFTVSTPYRYCPSLKEAKVLYIQCVAQAPMDIEFRELKTGIFLITVYSEADKKKLVGKYLPFDFGENGHSLHSVKVPFNLQEKRPFYQNPKWVSVDKLYASGLQYASHEQVDAFLANYGTVIVPTKDKVDEHGFRTGKRDAKIDLVKDIDRWQSVTLKVKVEGKEVEVTGKVNFYYKGQPYNCRDCLEVHQDKCPQKVIRETAEAEGEKVRKAKSKTLFIGDSNLRRVNEHAFFAKTDCATGAKIGHIANSLEWTSPGEHENVIVHAGQNNVSTDPKVDMETWERDMKEEVDKLKDKVSGFKNVVLVGVPPAPSCMKTDKTRAMRESINGELKVLAENPKVRYVPIEQYDEDDEGNWEDEKHMTEKFTNYMLSKVTIEMYEVHGGEFFIKNVPWTCEGKYKGVNTTYKLGCGKCTGMGHAETHCEQIVKAGKRQTRPSGGASPPYNKKHSKGKGNPNK